MILHWFRPHFDFSAGGLVFLKNCATLLPVGGRVGGVITFVRTVSTGTSFFFLLRVFFWSARFSVFLFCVFSVLLYKTFRKDCCEAEFFFGMV